MADLMTRYGNQHPLTVYFTEEEIAKVNAAAHQAGKRPSGYVRDRALNRLPTRARYLPVMADLQSILARLDAGASRQTIEALVLELDQHVRSELGLW